MLAIILNLLLLAGGIGVLIAGGELLVRGSVAISLRLGIAPLVVGLTVVAFGTSAPELALNMVAAAKNNPGLSFGNIVGSNIANVGLVLGLAALMAPLYVNDSVIRRELPLMLGVSILACLLGLGEWLVVPEGGFVGFSRIDGAILLGCFFLFLITTIVGAKKGKISPTLIAQEQKEVEQRAPKGSLVIPIVFVCIGLAALVAGGWMSERGASALARAFGMSDELVGLTIVAVATSLPELFTSLVAVRKGHVDLAVGNVVGSNIFNLLLIMGATAMVRPVPVPRIPWHAPLISMGVMLVLALLLWPFARTSERHVSRGEGTVLLGIYAAYIGYEVWVALAPGLQGMGG